MSNYHGHCSISALWFFFLFTTSFNCFGLLVTFQLRQHHARSQCTRYWQLNCLQSNRVFHLFVFPSKWQCSSSYLVCHSPQQVVLHLRYQVFKLRTATQVWINSCCDRYFSISKNQHGTHALNKLVIYVNPSMWLIILRDMIQSKLFNAVWVTDSHTNGKYMICLALAILICSISWVPNPRVNKIILYVKNVNDIPIIFNVILKCLLQQSKHINTLALQIITRPIIQCSYCSPCSFLDIQGDLESSNPTNAATELSL